MVNSIYRAAFNDELEKVAFFKKKLTTFKKDPSKFYVDDPYDINEHYSEYLGNIAHDMKGNLIPKSKRESSFKDYYTSMFSRLSPEEFSNVENLIKQRK